MTEGANTSRHCFTCHELTQYLDVMSNVGNLNYNKDGFKDTYFDIQRLKEEHIKQERSEEQKNLTASIYHSIDSAQRNVPQSPSDLKAQNEERLQASRLKTWEKAKNIYANSNSATKAHKDMVANVSPLPILNPQGKDFSALSDKIEKNNEKGSIQNKGKEKKLTTGFLIKTFENSMKTNAQTRSYRINAKSLKKKEKCLTRSFGDRSILISLPSSVKEHCKGQYRIDLSHELPPEKPSFLREKPSFSKEKIKSKHRDR